MTEPGCDSHRSTFGNVPPPSAPHVGALDGLRGVAVLLVMASHYAGSLDVLGVRTMAAAPFRLGWAGVDVFFALSGFLITGILLDARDQPRFFRHFYARRALRIAPLYYAAILVVAAMRWAVGPDHVWGDTEGVLAPGSLVWPLFYLQNVAFALDGPFQTGILAHYWSLAVEEHFYLVWPLLVWACSRRMLAVVAGLAAAGSVLLRAVAAAGGADPVWIMGLTPLRLDGLALGALASLLLRSGLPVPARTRLALVVAGAAAATLCGLVVGRHSLSQFDPVLWVFGYTCVAAASAALILVASVPGPAASALGTPLLRWFGRYSFGLYVWHPIIAVMLLHSTLSPVRPGQPALVILAAIGATAAVTLGCAWISFHGFEQPFLALKRFFPAHGTPRPARQRRPVAPGAGAAGARTEIKALTGLRGVAAAYVVAFHFTGSGQLVGSQFVGSQFVGSQFVGSQPVGGAPGALLAHGYLAVDIFFVLSGYVMALTYGAGFAGPLRLAAFGSFLGRRIARVYPMYLVSTLACAALAWADPAMEGPLTAWTLLTNLAMAQAWGLSHSLDYPAWSISTECAAYLLFPLLALLALGGRITRCWATAAASALVLLALTTLSAAQLHEQGHRLGPLDIWSAETLYPVLRCLGGFTLGLCAWRLSATGTGRAIAAHPASGTFLAIAAVGLLLTPGADLAIVLLSVALLPALAHGQSLPARLLAAQPLHWLGTVSYSLYLVHYPVRWALEPGTRALLDGLGAPWPGPLTIVLLAAASLGLAACGYAWIERPGRDLARLLLRRRRRVPAGAAAE